jgi:heterodisulfide reductase subunit A-like polyferredoxin/coenzyme F420-reducing hydrogenase delta subunit
MKIGLFISGGEGLIDSVVDVKWLVKQYSNLDLTKSFKSFFDPQSASEMLKEVECNQLKGLVLAGDSPIFYQRTRGGRHLLETLEEAGVERNFMAIANLKEQVALPHVKRKKEATAKAKTLIDVSLAKIKNASPLEKVYVSPRRRVAVIGVTPGTILAAEQMLSRGYPVYLIDEEDLSEEFAKEPALASVYSFVRLHPKSTWLEGWKLEDIAGYVGDYTLGVVTSEGDRNELEVGGVIIASGEKSELNQELHQFLHLEVGDDGRFTSINSTNFPVQTIESGIVIIPGSLEDGLERLVAQADSAALSLISLLDQDELVHELAISRVDEDVCGGCGTCVKTCIFHASQLDVTRRRSYIDKRRCKGCGNCVTACPTGARDLLTFPSDYLFSGIKILSQYKGEEKTKVLVLLCEGCGYQAFDMAGTMGIEYPTTLLPLSVHCAGRIDTQLILYAFALDFDGVVVCECAEGRCRNLVGNLDLDRRANLFREVLRSRKIDPERLLILGVTPCDGDLCVEESLKFLDSLKQRRSSHG